MNLNPESPTPLTDPAPAGGEGGFGALLTPPEWSALRRRGRIQKYPRGAVLMYEGEPGDRVVILLSGRAKAVRVGHDGRERLLSIRDRGEILGELSFLDGEPRLSSVIALEPVEALVVTIADFRVYLEQTPRVAVALLESLSRRFRETTLKRSEFGELDTLGRLAARLVELAERYGEPVEQGTLIALPLTQEELGSWSGASPAAVAKALQTLREIGWIATERRRIVVNDLDSLRARAK